MYYYVLDGRLLISHKEYEGFVSASPQYASNYHGIAYILNDLDPLKSKRSFCVYDPSLCFLDHEDLCLMCKKNVQGMALPEWLLKKIDKREVTYLNTSYPNWKDVLYYEPPVKWRVNIVGLGDVGSTLSMGLKLLGSDIISRIGLYDRDEKKIKRWEYELGQIVDPEGKLNVVRVERVQYDSLFDCDMFVFCVSGGVPPVGSEKQDVRLAQFDVNSRIVSEYAKKARDSMFKGIFAVVSDPVDLLCKTVFLKGCAPDFKALPPENIRGYGLGVMNGRASYFASQNENTMHYLNEGRAFGPHGNGLIIADSMENYNEELSLYLTEKAKNANIEMRKIGYKPYVAPALSSGSLSLIATMKGEWNYSATFIGGVFFGARNRLNKSGIELETYEIPLQLETRLRNTYEELEKLL